MQLCPLPSGREQDSCPQEKTLQNPKEPKSFPQENQEK
jgi:hypothetical protein